ncbi:MAG: hypothetical protein C6W55_16540 [Thermobacillus sp.]|uniref:MBL fold metallo-hydrolase n=1 Tax=Thermobacillus sp. TaxID=2108467 RepID=UPI000E39FC8E|nr:MBL fold metallo-hydrolase [Thermobacillus sp.]REK52372.1 MAG: hypothetical protein C6W55_16540 [Thermobacillus sp.]
MKIQLVRHATLVLRMSGFTIAVDPMLSPAGALAPAAPAANDRRNPLVDLPAGFPGFGDLDGVIVTHTHRDHLDDAAVEELAKDLPIFCQAEDEAKLSERGFRNMVAVRESAVWSGIRLTRTGGRHGTDEMAQKMGPVSGFVLGAKANPSSISRETGEEVQQSSARCPAGGGMRQIVLVGPNATSSAMTGSHPFIRQASATVRRTSHDAGYTISASSFRSARVTDFRRDIRCVSGSTA